MADETLPLPFEPRPQGKRCKRCRKIKLLSEFHYRPELTRHRAECKDCYRAAMTERRDPEVNRARVKKWLKDNPDKRRASSKRRHERLRGDVGRWLASNLRTTRAYCKRRGLPINITATDLVALFEARRGQCALTGRALIYGSKGQQRDSISIDRIEPTLGYVVGNIRLITYQANMARGPFSDDELFAFCEAVLAARGRNQYSC